MPRWTRLPLNYFNYLPKLASILLDSNVTVRSFSFTLIIRNYSNLFQSSSRTIFFSSSVQRTTWCKFFQLLEKWIARKHQQSKNRNSQTAQTETTQINNIFTLILDANVHTQRINENLIPNNTEMKEKRRDREREKKRKPIISLRTAFVCLCRNPKLG